MGSCSAIAFGLSKYFNVHSVVGIDVFLQYQCC